MFSSPADTKETRGPFSTMCSSSPLAFFVAQEEREPTPQEKQEHAAKRYKKLKKGDLEKVRRGSATRRAGGTDGTLPLEEPRRGHRGGQKLSRKIDPTPPSLSSSSSSCLA